MECLLCNVSDTTVAFVATCSNRCMVMAHPKCWAMRKVTPVWRKKHHDRNNYESEVCVVVGCQGKSRVKLLTQASECDNDVHTAASVPSVLGAVTPLDDPSHPCCFIGRDGLPCRRPAVSQNACTRHAYNANYLCSMIKRQNLVEKSTPTSETVPQQEFVVEKTLLKNAVVQTTECIMQTKDDLRMEIDQMNYAAHREALRITRLEIQLEKEREELDMEWDRLRSTSEKEAHTITTLKEEMERLRLENVTLKRREESIKAKFMASRVAHKKELALH